MGTKARDYHSSREDWFDFLSKSNIFRRMIERTHPFINGIQSKMANLLGLNWLKCTGKSKKSEGKATIFTNSIQIFSQRERRLLIPFSWWRRGMGRRQDWLRLYPHPRQFNWRTQREEILYNIHLILLVHENTTFNGSDGNCSWMEGTFRCRKKKPFCERSINMWVKP